LVNGNFTPNEETTEVSVALPTDGEVSMNSEDLARDVAAELSQKYSDSEILQKAEAVLKHGPQKYIHNRTTTREMAGIDPIAIAILVVHCAQLAFEVHRTVRDKSALIERLKDRLRTDESRPTAGVTGRQIEDVVQAAADKISPAS